MAVEELYAIAAAMRQSAAGGLASDMRSELRRGRGPVKTAVTTSVLAGLPKRGRLNVWTAEFSYSYQVRGSRKIVAAVRVGKAGHDLQGLDGGLVIHPGNRYGRGWYSQPVPPGTISNPIQEEGGHQLELSAEVAMDKAAVKIISA
jgi:hypothetical protein